ncbi:unnamed protein product [Trichobilharzia regenti]|nr:unnamed protein product [Trichobilharzia regenti]
MMNTKILDVFLRINFDIVFLLVDLASTGGKYFFNLVKEGDSVVFATDDENERQLWIQAIYRATGQTHKPVPPSKDATGSNNTALQNVNLFSGNKSSSAAAISASLSRGTASAMGNRTQGGKQQCNYVHVLYN